MGTYELILLMIVITGLIIFFIVALSKKTKKKKKNQEIRRFNELVQTFIESEEIPVSLKDEQFKYIFVNEAMEEFYGKDSMEIIGYDDFDFMDELVAIKQRKSDKKVLETRSFVIDQELGKGNIYKTTKFPVDLLNGNFGIGSYIRIVAGKEKYLQTLLSIGDGVLVVDPQGKIEMLNSMAEKITGWSAENAFGRHYKDVFILQHEVKGGIINDPIETVFKTKVAKELDSHAVLVSKQGKKYHLENNVAPISDDEGKLIGAVILFKDVTDKKEQGRINEYLSFHDSLTGLYNRRFFEEEMNRLDIERNLPISIIIGDVDGLKLTNDIFGHDAGDEILIKVSEIFKKVCRADDIIARWGGDEFAILLPQTQKNEAQKITERIKDNFSKEKIKGIKGSVSMGYATKYKLAESILGVLAGAEENMYMEKTLERGQNKEDTFNVIIDTLYGAFPDEAKHARRTSEICKKIGRKMDLTEDDINKVAKAAYLHDIGKVALDKEALKKSAKPTDDEWKEMKLHPVVGYRILNAFDHTMDLAIVVLGHHERWDGTGYPQGSKSEETPRLARIIAVGEHFDEMTTDKLYRNAVSNEVALEEMRRNAGTHYDPDIVDALAKVVFEESH